jgi:C-terminal peptidase prc
MSAWDRRLFGIASTVLLLSTEARSAVPPNVARPAKPPAAALQYRAEAAAAERAGDWEAAFAAYCRLYTADRQSPDVREKLNNSLRRVQQARRHHEGPFRQFTLNLEVDDGLDLFRDVLLNVPPLYADRDKAMPQQMWEHGVEEFDRALASPAFRQAFLDNPSPGRVEKFRGELRTHWARRTVGSAREGRAALLQLIAAAQDAFPVRFPSAIAVEFVCGSCAGLDEYTVFLSPGEFAPDPAAADLSAHGLYLGARDGAVVIEGVAVGSWAALHTDLRKGDRIVSVNGHSAGLAVQGALADALRTPADGFHEVQSVPAGSASPRVSRFPVILPTVYGKAMVSDRDGVGYVRIGSFAAGTLGELDDAVAYLKARGARVLILDLRGNHGGSFTAGVEVARRLLPSGIIVTTQGQVGEVASRVFSSESGMDALDLPLVVLIDAETASAAEVVAAALKDNGRAVVVGMASFGKGAVQIPVKLGPADEADDPGRARPKSSGVRVTIARLFSPRGTPINGAGVTPNALEADPVRQLQLAIDRALEQLPAGPRSPMPVPTIP